MVELTAIGSGSITVARPIRPRVPGERSIISKFADKIRSALSRGAYWGAGFTAAGSGWTDPRWWSENPDDWPLRPTETDALGLPPFGRGLELIASTIAGVDLVAHRYDKEDRIDVRLDPQPELLRDPDPVSTPWNWKYALVNDMILYGNHFAFYGPPNAEGWPRWLEPIDATIVDISVSESGVWWRVNGEIYPYGDLFHINAGNRSGYLLGRGLLFQYAEALGGVLETDRHSSRYFRRSGLPTAVIKVTDPDLKPETAAAIKAKYVETFSGRSREPMVIPGHYEFTPIVSDAEKQQLVEARSWDATLVAMILGVPAHLLNMQGPTMTYSNVETADIAFVRDTVNRWGQPLESAVTKWLLPAGQKAKLDWLGRLRTDSKTRAEVIKIEAEAGVLEVNEGRQMLQRPPIDEPEPVIPPQLQAFTGQPDQDQQIEPLAEVAE